jgi:hypothetical protein
LRGGVGDSAGIDIVCGLGCIVVVAVVSVAEHSGRWRSTRCDINVQLRWQVWHSWWVRLQYVVMQGAGVLVAVSD